MRYENLVDHSMGPFLPVICLEILHPDTHVQVLTILLKPDVSIRDLHHIYDGIVEIGISHVKILNMVIH